VTDIAHDQRADLLEAAKSGGPLFPPGFIYRPPIEQICGCGRKHTGAFQSCGSCSAQQSQRPQKF